MPDPITTQSSAITNAPLTPSRARLTLSPSHVELHQEEQQQFIVLVADDPTNAVTWNITPTVGSISADGLYKPPSSLGPTETVQVIATSKLDPTQSATADVRFLKPKLMPPEERIGFGIGLVLFGIILCALAIAYWPLSDLDVTAAETASAAAAKELQSRHALTANANQELEVASQASAGAPNDTGLKTAVANKNKAVIDAKAAEGSAEQEAKNKNDALKAAQDATVRVVGISGAKTGLTSGFERMPRELTAPAAAHPAIP